MNLIDRIVALWKQQHPEEPLEDLRKTAAGLSRRRFLAIAGSTAALVATGGLEVLARPMVVVPDMDAVLVTTDLQWVTKEALHLLKKSMTLPTVVDRGYMAIAAKGDTVHIGNYGPTPVMVRKGSGWAGPQTVQVTVAPPRVTNQLWLDADPNYVIGQTLSRRAARQRIVEPIASSFRHRIQHEGITSFAELPLPRGLAGQAAICTDRETGLSVRGVLEFDARAAQSRVVFDVAGCKS